MPVATLCLFALAGATTWLVRVARAVLRNLEAPAEVVLPAMACFATAAFSMMLLRGLRAMIRALLNGGLTRIEDAHDFSAP